MEMSEKQLLAQWANWIDALKKNCIWSLTALVLTTVQP